MLKNKRIDLLKIIAISVWSALLLILWVISFYNCQKNITKVAYIQADGILKKDLIEILWNSQRGGIYTYVSDEVRPNPLLKKIPNRDIILASGKKLTLLCPAGMLHLLSHYAKTYQIKERIISFYPINPKNVPKKWERDALVAFKNKDIKEYSTIIKEGGERFFCLARPTIAEKSCLRCHPYYKLGNKVGAITVQIPMTKYESLQLKRLLTNSSIYFIIYIVGCLGIGWSTNIIKKDAMEIEQHQAKLEDIYSSLENANFGIVLTDKYYKITYMNNIAKDWFGDHTGEICYKAIFDLDTPCPICKDGIEPKDVLPYEISRPDGKVFELIKGVLREKEEDFSRLVIVRDITREKKIEKEMAKIEKLESLGLLAGGIAHDFNNLLSGIFGNIELAKIKLSPDHPSLGHLETAHKEIKRAISLTKQLLAFSKGGEPILEDVNIEKLIQDVTRFHLSGSKVRANFRIQEGIWHIKADKGQISQVISNLIINAVQAMPDGGNIYIDVSNIELSDGSDIPLKGKYVKISIKDEGIGIPKRYLDKIFDPYFTTKQKGSGLGLSIVYSIVKRHRGYISVDSELGIGTTFIIYLPAIEKSYKIQSEDKKKSEDASSKKKRVLKRALIMEDEESVRNTLKEMLRISGYEVDASLDGDEAIRKYVSAKEEGRPYDVVIMDLTIKGGMGGEEAIKKLLSIDPEAKVIVTSGYSDSPILANYKKYGFKGRLLKPFTLQDLKKELLRIESCD